MGKKKYTFIDLFAGCGGLSEGFYRQGFKALAHVEFDHACCETLRTRMKYYGYKDYDKEVIEYDITSKDILERIDDAVAGRIVDIIIGTKPKALYCNSLNSVVIICDSGTSSKTDLIKIWIYVYINIDTILILCIDCLIYL